MIAWEVRGTNNDRVLTNLFLLLLFLFLIIFLLLGPGGSFCSLQAPYTSLVLKFPFCIARENCAYDDARNLWQGK
jgi:hypothetical protein